MSQIDQKFVLGSSTIEFHVGTPQAFGTNPLPPSHLALRMELF